MTEWRRLCQHLGIDPDDNDEYRVRETKRQLRTAMVLQFNDMYGTSVDDLQAWRRLFEAIGIEPVPGRMKEYREVREDLRSLCSKAQAITDSY